MDCFIFNDFRAYLRGVPVQTILLTYFKIEPDVSYPVVTARNVSVVLLFLFMLSV